MNSHGHDEINDDFLNSSISFQEHSLEYNSVYSLTFYFDDFFYYVILMFFVMVQIYLHFHYLICIQNKDLSIYLSMVFHTHK